MKELNDAIYIIRDELIYTMSDDLLNAYELLLIVQERLGDSNEMSVYKAGGIKDETLRVEGELF